jgi:P22_AR N-terminal domain.
MNDLIVKKVPFCGAELLAVKEKNTGKIYAGINSILRELGFDERQIEYRRNKWNNDKVLAKGVQKFLYPSENGGIQDTYCMAINKLPIALAKIEITPKLEKQMPELSEKLEQYQESCATVLAEAFISHESKEIIPKDFPSALRAYADEYEKRMQLEQKNEKLIEENNHKQTVINGLTENIPIYEKPDIINRICRKSQGGYANRYNELYKCFRENFHTDLKMKCENYNEKQIKKKDQLTTIRYAEKFGFIDDLYTCCVKLYESEVREILKELDELHK